MAENNVAENHQNSGCDSWMFQNHITVTPPTGLSSKEIAAKLNVSRRHFEELKQEYKRTRKGSPKETAVFHEIVRTALVINMFKNQLVVDGVRFAIEEKHIEHPDAARKRLSWW